MIPINYHFLSHAKYQTGLDGEDFCYFEFITLLNKGISLNKGIPAHHKDRFAYEYKDDFLERRIDFFKKIFRAKGLECADNVKAVSSSEEGGPAVICFRFSPNMADKVTETALEIEASAAKSRSALASFHSCDALSHPKPGTTKFNAAFEPLNGPQTGEAVYMLTSAFGAHGAFDPETSVDNQTPGKTKITLTFPIYHPLTTDILTMEIANAAALAQGGTPLQAFYKLNPAGKLKSPKLNEMN